MRLVQELKWQDGETGPKDFPIPLLGHTARRQDGAVNRTFSLLVQSAVNVRVDPSAWAANVTIEGLHEVVPDPPGSSVELSPSGLFHRYIGSVEVTATPSPARKPGDPPIDIWYSVNPLLGTEHTTCVALAAVTSVCVAGSWGDGLTFVSRAGCRTTALVSLWSCTRGRSRCQ